MIDRFLPVAGSLHAADLDRVLFGIHWHMAIQAMAWGLFFVYVLVRFRRGANPEPRKTTLPSSVAVIAIGAVIVGDAFLLATEALPAWIARSAPPAFAPPESVRSYGAASPALEIGVVAEQFVWNIHYPGPDGRFGRTSQALIGVSNPLGIDRRDPDARDDIGILNSLTLPLGRTIVIHLSSRDVIHSFTLNEMRVRQDAVPGMPATTWFTPIVTGHWDIACSQLCGIGHYRMRGEYSVVPPEEWNRWLASEVALLAPEPPR